MATVVRNRRDAKPIAGPDVRAWVDEFVRKHGRPPRILHIGNIANNAYNNAKLQRRAGIEADVLCYNYFHIMGTPEWEDADFDGEISDHYFPNWREVDLRGFQRPDWFIQGDLASCASYLEQWRRKPGLARWLYRIRLRALGEAWCVVMRVKTLTLGREFRVRETLARAKAVAYELRAASVGSIIARLQTRIFTISPTRARIAQGRIPALLERSIIKPALQFLIGLLAVGVWVLLRISKVGKSTCGVARRCLRQIRAWCTGRSARELGVTDLSMSAFQKRCDWVEEQWKSLFPSREPLDREALNQFYPNWVHFSRILPHYDLVQAYATDPWWPMLCHAKPYVAYEHGTLREFPQRRGIIGQLCSLSYRLSEHAFITNGDCLTFAQELGIQRFSAMLHGIDDAKHGPSSALRAELQKKYGVQRLYLCPNRHDWKVKGTDTHIRALPKLVAKSGRDFKLFLTKWGAEVEASQKLADELGVSEQIVWIEPLPRRKLVAWMAVMDCVLDQICLPHFGATAPEAMGCGVPVIMSYDPAATAWIIPEPAPILSAWTPDAVAEHLVALVDPEYRQRVCQSGLGWFQRNHTSQRILADHVEVYRRLLVDKTTLQFSSQNRKEAA